MKEDLENWIEELDRIHDEIDSEQDEEMEVILDAIMIAISKLEEKVKNI